MAIVTAEIRFAPQLAAWFTANPTLVLADGELAYCSDGANAGKYKMGDGTTQLSALTFYGGVSASGLTIGTTTITSGTNTRILYNNAGVVGEYLVTGTGTTAVLSTSPTFGTDITTPLIIGGTAVGSVIQYKGTTGVGTSAVAAHQFLVGNNGATTAGVIYNTGQWNLGNGVANPSTTVGLLRLGQGTSITDIGQVAGGVGGIWFSTGITPSAVNFNISGSQTFLSLNAPSSSGVINFMTNGGNRMTMGHTSISFAPAPAGAGAIQNFTFTAASHSSQTANTNIPIFKVTGTTTSKIGASDAVQYFNWFTSNTISYSSASTLTLGANAVFEYMQGGTNATITTSAAIYVPTLALTNTGTSYGIYVNAASGATNNYAVGMNGKFYLDDSTASCYIQKFNGNNGYTALYLNNVTPGATNYTLIGQATNTYLNSPTTLNFGIGGVVYANLTASVWQMGCSLSMGAQNITSDTTTGTKIGTATTQKLGFWNATPIVQPTTAVAASTLTSNGGTTLTSTDTIDGYTILQVVKALRNTGLLA